MKELKIEAYSLADYTQQVIDAGKKGYEVSEDNDKYPYNFTGYFFAILVKDEVQAVEEVEETKVVSKGRPKKV